MYKVMAIPGQILIFAFERIITWIQGNAPFFDSNDYPWTRTLRQNCPLIQKELSAVLDSGEYIPELKEVSPEQARISKGQAWKTFFFHAYGRKLEENCRRCPETAELLEQIPGMTTAFFSILTPQTRLTPHRGPFKGHRGPFKGVLRYHLALMVPKDADKCGIRIAGET